MINRFHSPFDPDLFVLDCRGHILDCRPGGESGAHVMGILNVTPDSFSDGGTYFGVEAAIRRAEEMLTEGAAILDVGGESTRPKGSTYGAGAAKIQLDEEYDRVLPVVKAISSYFPDAIISVDTYKPEVAHCALEAGAHMINDITGLRYSRDTAAVAAAFGAPIVVMHSLGRPGSMPHEHQYQDVVAEVKKSLQAAIDTAEQAGVRHVITDPGFGFGKLPVENLRLIKEMSTFLNLGRPVLVGISRKSTIGAFLGTPEHPAPIGERLFGTLGATAAAVRQGASIVRTHDVRPTVEMLKVLAATTDRSAYNDNIY